MQSIRSESYLKLIANSDFKVYKSQSYLLKKKAGSFTLPDINREQFPDRSGQGLEGPFRQHSGHVLYYDSKQGQYYDPSTDMYVSTEEYEAMQRSSV